MITRVNKACKYFPCHTKLEDCTFCYCPFYPCLDEGLGEYIYSPGQKRYIWSCQNCTWIHSKKTVDNIFNFIKANKDRFPRRNKKIAKCNQKRIDKEIAVIILCHGSKLKGANNSIEESVARIKKSASFKNIATAYLQLSSPNLGKAVEGFAKKGSKKIIIIPFFLFEGNHVTRDVPEAIQKQKIKHPNIEFICVENLSADKRIYEILRDKINNALVPLQLSIPKFIQWRKKRNIRQNKL